MIDLKFFQKYDYKVYLKNRAATDGFSTGKIEFISGWLLGEARQTCRRETGFGNGTFFRQRLMSPGVTQ